MKNQMVNQEIHQQLVARKTSKMLKIQMLEQIMSNGENVLESDAIACRKFYNKQLSPRTTSKLVQNQPPDDLNGLSSRTASNG